MSTHITQIKKQHSRTIETLCLSSVVAIFLPTMIHITLNFVNQPLILFAYLPSPYVFLHNILSFKKEGTFLVVQWLRIHFPVQGMMWIQSLIRKQVPCAAGQAHALQLLSLCTLDAQGCTGNGEGNGNPLQCSCLENPRDRGAWWAAVYGVAQSQTRLKRLSSSSRIYFRIR